MGIRDGTDLRIKIQRSSYLNTELLLEYVRGVFLPAVENNRKLPGYRGNLAKLFCDNCSCHCSDEILRELASHGIFLIAYPPHSSHIFQVLDVLLFVKLKSAKTSIPRDLTQSPIINYVLCVFQTSEEATTNTIVRSSWQKNGFGFIQRDDTFCLWIDESKICSSATFSEMWNTDYSESGLSGRQWQQKWEWLNETIFRVEFHDLAHPAASQE
jgi:hypothetical protein